MSRYPNGKIPSSELVNVGPNHWLTRATAARWANLVADVQSNEGVRLQITPGENAFRSYAGQQHARTAACNRGRCGDAAWPGTSSHGGVYNGRDSMAIDVNNWMAIGQNKFYSYARKHGFEPGFFSWEPWHIIDWNPWTMPAGGASGGSTPKPEPELIPEEEEEEMKGATVKLDNGKSKFILFNEVSGFYVAHSGVKADYNNSIAQKWETNSWPTITEAHDKVLQAALAAVRQGK